MVGADRPADLVAMVALIVVLAMVVATPFAYFLYLLLN